MNRLALLLATTLIGVAAAQVEIDDPPPLKDDLRLRYLLLNLALDAQQTAAAKTLLEQYLQNRVARVSALPVEEIRRLNEELNQAVSSGDAVAQERISARLRDLARVDQFDEEFMRGLHGVLSPEQRDALEYHLERLTRNPSGMLRPVDVLYVAWRLPLTPELRVGLAQVEQDFRRAVNADEMFVHQRSMHVTQLIGAVQRLLPADERRAFDEKIKRLRADDVRSYLND